MAIKLLSNKTFSIFIGGKAISVIGSNIQQFALSLYVYALTGSATLFATMLSISILPRLLFSPVAGVMGDWFNRKKMIVRLDLFNAILLTVFATYFFFNQRLELLLIYALIIVLEIGELFYESAASGVIPSIVEEKDYTTAKSIQSIVINIGRLLSPMLGALLYGVLGLLAVLIVNAISFLVAGIMELFMNVPTLQKRPATLNVKSFFKDLKEGFIIIKDNHLIRTIIILGTVINFVIGPLFTVGFLVIIIDTLGASEFQFGLYQSFMAASMIIGPMIVMSSIKKYDTAKVCFMGFVVTASLTIVMALVPSHFMLNRFQTTLIPFALLMALSFAVGLTASIINISISTLFAKTVPIEAMGRTSSVMNLLITMFIPIGQITYGILLDNIHPSFIMILSGAIIFAALIIFKRSLLMSTLKTTKDPLKGMIPSEVHVS